MDRASKKNSSPFAMVHTLEEGFVPNDRFWIVTTSKSKVVMPTFDSSTCIHFFVWTGHTRVSSYIMTQAMR